MKLKYITYHQTQEDSEKKRRIQKATEKPLNQNQKIVKPKILSQQMNKQHLQMYLNTNVLTD